MGMEIQRAGIFSQSVGVSAPLLLDLYPNASAAYSLRQLKTGVNNVVRVRRSSDDAEQDFTETQITDGTLTTFTGAGDGFVSIWYDQSGNSIDFTIDTVIEQPSIVLSGAIVLADGLPALTTDDASSSTVKTMQATFPSTQAAPISVTTVHKFDTSDFVAGQYIFSGFSGGQMYSYNQAATNLRISLGTAATWTGDTRVGTNIYFTRYDGANSEILKNNSLTSGIINTGTNVRPTVINLSRDSAQFWQDKFFLQELIFWDSDKTSDSVGIVNETNSYYNAF